MDSSRDGRVSGDLSAELAAMPESGSFGEANLVVEEQRLLKEMESLALYKGVVESGPDIFSFHGKLLDAPFRFVGDGFLHRLHLAPTSVLGRPLASIVDSRDQDVLSEALDQLFNSDKEIRAGEGTVVELRVVCGSGSRPASMSISIGSEGLIVVTRLYDLFG